MAAIPAKRTRNASRLLPLYLSASLIVGFGIATAATANIKQQSTPPKQVPPPGQAKPPEVKKPVVPHLDIAEVVPGITFADTPGVVYVVGRTLAERLKLDIELDKAEKVLTIGEKKFEGFRRLYAGDILIPIREISKFDGTIELSPEEDTMVVRGNTFQFDVIIGKKHIEVDKAAQELTAFQGKVVVLKTNVSTGRPGHNTPIGEFTTGSKERMHYSHKYNDAEMPYAVQVNGDVFFHGYGSVPAYPASHGCIRVPLGRKKPAKYLYGWVNRGVGVKIFGTYEWEKHHSKKRRK